MFITASATISACAHFLVKTLCEEQKLLTLTNKDIFLYTDTHLDIGVRLCVCCGCGNLHIQPNYFRIKKFMKA